MNLLLQRKIFTPNSITGQLFIDGKFQCYTIERPREDIKGANPPFAIPAGIYPVAMRWSNHFQMNVPGVNNVPGRTDIEIHVANYPTDVKGCIGVGNILDKDAIGDSRIAFQQLLHIIQGEENAIYLQIS